MPDRDVRRPGVVPRQRSSDAPPAGAEAVATQIVEAVTDLPGVRRLQPALGPASIRRLVRPAAADGAQVMVRGDLVDVDINLATIAGHRASDVAARVRSRTMAVIEGAGYTPGSVSVNVLVIESAQTGT